MEEGEEGVEGAFEDLELREHRGVMDGTEWCYEWNRMEVMGGTKMWVNQISYEWNEIGYKGNTMSYGWKENKLEWNKQQQNIKSELAKGEAELVMDRITVVMNGLFARDRSMQLCYLRIDQPLV